MPVLPTGSEWADYFDAVVAAFGLRIEETHPDFGTEPLHDVIAGAADIATFVPEQLEILWPDGHDLRRVLVRARRCCTRTPRSPPCASMSPPVAPLTPRSRTSHAGSPHGLPPLLPNGIGRYRFDRERIGNTITACPLLPNQHS